MANQVVTLTVPANDGIGASSDVSALAYTKSFNVAGIFTGNILIEASLDGGVSFTPVGIIKPGNNGADVLTLECVCQLIRCRKIGTTVTGAPTITISAVIASSQFSGIDVPVNDGVGAITNVFAFGPLLTVSVTGAFDGAIVIEASGDNIAWNAIMRFQPGQVIQNFKGTFRYVRARRIYATGEYAAPVANIAGSAPASTGTPNAIVSIDDIVKSRAADVLGTSVAGFTYWSEPFLNAPDRPGSQWVHSNGSTLVYEANDAPSGVVLFRGGTTNGCWVYPYKSNDLPNSADPCSWIGQVTDNAAPFYMFFRFRLMVADFGQGWSPDCSLIMGMLDIRSMAVAGVGLGVGGNLFAGVGGHINSLNTLDATVTTVLRDENWHYGEMVMLPGLTAPRFFARFDDVAWVEFTNKVLVGAPNTGFNNGIPVIQVMTTLNSSPLLPIMEVDHVGFAVIKNGADINARTSPPL